MRRQLRRSFRRLEAERDRLRLLLERLHEGVLTIDQDLVVHFANTEARRMLGGRLREGDELPEPWQGFGLREFAHGLFDERASVTQVHVTPDEQHAYGVVGIPSQPETDWALLVVDDLTEQERRELAEREFVSNAAHELRTPLTTIIGAVEVLQAGREGGSRRARPLPRPHRAGVRPAGAARARDADAGPRALRAGAAARRGGRARAAPARGRGRPPAARRRRGRRRGRATGSRSRRIATCSSRRCATSARTPRSTRRAARSSSAPTRDGNTVTVEVEDSGPGISPEVQRHVFDRFYRGERDADGFGLGLAIVRESVRTLGARIELDSSPGEGTHVPDRARAARACARRCRRRERRKGSGSSLVDDDAGVRDVVAFTLRREGYEVDEERDGQSALESGRSGRYSLVVLDVMLPGLSGVEVCRALRAESDVPILMLTARDAESDRVLGLELGADDYVTKPFSSAELLSRVRAILRRRELDRAGGGGTVRKLGGLQIDLGRHEVLVDGERVHLTLSEFKVLSLLAEQPEAVVSRRELMQHLWASEHVGDEHACEVHISNLRRKIERDPSQPERLVTMRGSGYKLVAA